MGGVACPSVRKRHREQSRSPKFSSGERCAPTSRKKETLAAQRASEGSKVFSPGGHYAPTSLKKETLVARGASEELRIFFWRALRALQSKEGSTTGTASKRGVQNFLLAVATRPVV